MDMDIKFACETSVVSHPRTGDGVVIRRGEHWPAHDPVVRAYPEFFTDDARFGLTASVQIGESGYPEYDPRDEAPSTRRGGKQ